ncbi:MAG: hypothetical protein K6F23_09805 [Solobacterium sp.]|nr:hypothetical protein [Solobacterium sp.]
MSEKNNNVNKVLNTLASDPSKMNDMLKDGTEGVVRGILADEKLSDSEVSAITKQVSENNIMKLFLGAEGQIDAENLMKLTGGFSSKADGVTRASGIGALLDGKLDANDLLAVMNMLQSTSGNNTSAQQSSPTGGLLSALLGGGAQPQQAQQPQQNSTGSLLGNLFGTQPQQPQTQTTSANATVTLSGMQLAQIMQMFTKEQLKITQAQAKQSVTLNGSQLKQMLNQLGGKVYTASKQTVTLTGLQLAQIMSMLGSGNVQITQAQASQNITLNAKQMGQLMSQLTGQPAAASAVNQQPAAAPANNGYGQVFSLNGNNTTAQNTSPAGNLNTLMNLASLLMGKK